MKTEYYKVDPEAPDARVISRAAALIRQGEVVAFPTETVYGLGASAFDEEAVRKIFIAKGRPSDNPIIVHISDTGQLVDLVKWIPEEARVLMDRFWPGPLTLVMESLPTVAPAVRAGRDTVGIRMPRHPVALALIKEAGPLAAPSANLSGRPSPTSAEHVKADMDGRIRAVLDAGTTGLGIESTVLDVTRTPFRVLRPGTVTFEELEEILPGKVVMAKGESPADRYPHYQTNAEIVLAGELADIQGILAKHKEQGNKVGLVVHTPDKFLGIMDLFDKVYELPADAGEAGKLLYAILRDADDRGLGVLFFEPYPEEGKALALMHRVKKASRHPD